MTLTNRTGQEQSAVVLRSWSGAYLNAETSPCASEELNYQCYGAAFSPGGLRVNSAEVASQPVQWAWLDEASTVLSLPAEWGTGESVRVRLECTVASRTAPAALAMRTACSCWAMCSPWRPCGRTVRGAWMPMSPWATPFSANAPTGM